MEITRKDFFKKACLSGACLCGFASVGFTADNSLKPDSSAISQDDNKQLVQNWISKMLSAIDGELDDEIKRRVLKKTSEVHYDNLKMDDMLSPYIGDLDKFIGFLEEKWGWKVDYDKAAKTLTANENKDYCVCPVSDVKSGSQSSVMCYCSEGFAEKMFSKVACAPASATVISSVRRGDKTCVYRVVFS
jgi:hypothetical protein